MSLYLDTVVESALLLADLPRWIVCSAFGTGFLAYYYYKVVKPPVLACSKGEYRNFLETNVPLIKEKFWPTLWCFESRLQTILAPLMRYKMDVQYNREVIDMVDGGRIALDWARMGENFPDTTPIILILPGLTGSSATDYIRGLVMAGSEAGFRCVVFINRGIDVELMTPVTYCATKIDDLAHLMTHIKQKYPAAPLAATGISMGGLILGNYLTSAEYKEKNDICAAMLISVPFDVFKASENIQQLGVNLLLNKHLANCLIRLVQNSRHILDSEDKPWNIEEVINSKTIQEFDRNFTTKVFGYESVEEYYQEANLYDKLAHIKTPVLCLNAVDDPFQPFDCHSEDPLNKMFNHENIAIVFTARGGHIGFLEGLWPVKGHQEYMYRFFSQYFLAMFKDDMYKQFLTDD